MGFGIIMFMRILFGVCMVFIIGYVFAGFSKNPGLVVLTKIATILAVVLFIAINGLLMRFAFSRQGNDKAGCGYWKAPLPGKEHSK
ncbi:hypothetical protein DBR43_01945 [Pedobacter sp. KBW06]|uniref:hypothetical protein n=1 Tax=Pedobacter sp. KBW06 TaxID=2153359 RepID=UPI000F5A8956|nr:hypothetical protein [Pedobacter sp. KBW06]RQO74184.1 hypothetical protein DBR43_01945 [Pedobacter sp. KBW06]